MSRINPYGMVKSLRLDGNLTNFWSFDTGTVEYDENTQIPENTGTLITTDADTLDFTVQEIKNFGGLIDDKTKKLVVEPRIDLKKGDMVLNSSLVETAKVILDFIFENRLHLIVRTFDNGKDHS